MGSMEETLSNLFPTSWLDPYGNMPLNQELTAQIDITQVTTDNGIKITAVKTPPRAGTTSIKDAISMALDMGCCEIGPHRASQQAADLGKCDSKKPPEKQGGLDVDDGSNVESSEYAGRLSSFQSSRRKEDDQKDDAH